MLTKNKRHAIMAMVIKNQQKRKGVAYVVKTELLEQIINDKGIKYVAVAAKLGISYQALRLKLDSVREFKVSEIAGLADMLCLDADMINDIFFS